MNRDGSSCLSLTLKLSPMPNRWICGSFTPTGKLHIYSEHRPKLRVRLYKKVSDKSSFYLDKYEQL